MRFGSGALKSDHVIIIATIIITTIIIIITQPRPQGPPREKLPTRASHAEGPGDEVDYNYYRDHGGARLADW